jgi:hypothetical protein
MELKSLYMSELFYDVKNSINRTFMELKSCPVVTYSVPV